MWRALTSELRADLRWPLYSTAVKRRLSAALPNFPLAFLLAPLAAGFVAAAIVALTFLPFMSEMDFGGLWAAAVVTALVVALISTLYTAAIGGATVLYHRLTGQVPSAKTAVIVGLSAWLMPIGFMYITMFVQALAAPRTERPQSIRDTVLLVLISLAAAMAAALSFWLVGVRGREPAARKPFLHWHLV